MRRRAMKPAHSILLVEDNPADVKITQRALKQCGLEVDLIVARDGEEALDYLLRRGPYESAPAWRRPELVLMDINLPRVSGIECVAALKKARPSLQIIMLTVYADNDKIFKSLKAGASGYLLKETPPAEILKAISDVQAGGSPMSN